MEIHEQRLKTIQELCLNYLKQMQHNLYKASIIIKNIYCALEEVIFQILNVDDNRSTKLLLYNSTYKYSGKIA